MANPTVAAKTSGQGVTHDEFNNLVDSVKTKQDDNTVSTAQASAIAATLVTLRNGVPTPGDDLNKLYTLIQAVSAIVGGTTTDGDVLVNTVSELLAVFSAYPEGLDLNTILAGKVDKTSSVNTLTETTSGKLLDARQGKALKDLIDALQSSFNTLNSLVTSTTPDGDSLVNTIQELLSIFSTYPEGVSVVTALAGKLDVTTYNTNRTADLAQIGGFFSNIVQLRGGTSGSLDFQNTTGTGRSFVFIDINNNAYTVQEIARNGLTIDGVNIIQPANYNASTNDRVFKVLDIDSRLKAMSKLENGERLADLYSGLYNYVASPAGKLVGLANYGDSISPQVWGWLIKNGFAQYQNTGSFYPYGASGSGVGTALTATMTGVIPYQQAGVINQTVMDGVMVVSSITRSGSTATVTTASAHGLSVGNYATIANATQTEYNGVFIVTAISGNTFSYAVTGTPVTPATGTPTVYGGVGDFTYHPSARHTELANGATLTIDGGSNTTGYAGWKNFFATGPGMGSVQVDLINRSTSAVVNTATVNLSAGAVGAINIPFSATTSLTYQVRITATGKVIHLLTMGHADNGIIGVNFGRGSSTLAQNNFSNSAIFTYLCAQLSVYKITVAAKEESLPASYTDLNATSTRLNGITTASKLVISSLPDATSEITQIVIASMWRTWALGKNYAFFDARSVFGFYGSYAELTRLGWNGDGTHPIDPANSFVSVVMLGEMIPFPTLPGTVERRNVNNAQVTTAKVSIQNSVDPSQAEDVIIPYGGSDPANARVQNVREYALSSGARVANYDANGIQILNSTGAAGNLNGVGNVNSTGIISTSSYAQAAYYRGAGSLTTSNLGAGLGTGGTLVATGNSVGGKVTITVGTSPTSGGVIGRVNFAGNYGTCFVILQEFNDTALGQPGKVKVSSESGLYFELSAAAGITLTPGDTLVYNFMVPR